MEITLHGLRTIVHVNGEKVADFTDGDPVPAKTSDFEPDQDPPLCKPVNIRSGYFFAVTARVTELELGGIDEDKIRIYRNKRRGIILLPCDRDEETELPEKWNLFKKKTYQSYQLKFTTMKTNWISALSIVVFAAVLATGCEKEPGVMDTDLITAEDELITDAAFDDVFSEVDGIMNVMDQYGYELSSLKSASVLDTCPVISIITEGSFWPRTIVVDYGDGCDVSRSQFRERIRKGKILITVSGPMWQEGSYREVTFENFYINEHQVEGRRTVTNEGAWEDGEYQGMRYFSIQLEGGKVTTPEGQEISREVNHTRTFAQGFDTRWDTRDDIWYINGVATGVNRNGVAYTREITSPLWREIGCRFITHGTILIQADERPDVTLDYGDGTCDPVATITVNGETREVRLRKW